MKTASSESAATHGSGLVLCHTLLAYFEDIVNRFDRRFDSREPVLVEGPREDGDSVWIRGRAIYRAAVLYCSDHLMVDR